LREAVGPCLWCCELGETIVTTQSSSRDGRGETWFSALRQGMSVDVRARRPQRTRTPAMLADIARIEALWTETRTWADSVV